MELSPSRGPASYAATQGLPTINGIQMFITVKDLRFSRRDYEEFRPLGCDAVWLL
jgi:hypothetical protein